MQVICWERGMVMPAEYLLGFVNWKRRMQKIRKILWKREEGKWYLMQSIKKALYLLVVSTKTSKTYPGLKKLYYIYLLLEVILTSVKKPPLKSNISFVVIFK